MRTVHCQAWFPLKHPYTAICLGGHCLWYAISSDRGYYMQTRSRHKMTGGGGERVAHVSSLLSPPPTSVLRLKRTSWYMSDHYICQQYLWFLSLIFHLCWLWRNRELVWDIACFRFPFFPTRSLRLQGSEHLFRPCEHLSSNTSFPALKLKTIFQRRHWLLA